MALTKIEEPVGNINLYTNYAFEYHSDIYDVINFKYKIEFQEYITKSTTIFDGYNSNGAYFGTGATGNLISSSVFTGVTTQIGDKVIVGNLTGATYANGTYYINSATTTGTIIYVTGTTIFSGFTEGTPYFKITGLRTNWETIDTFERFPEPSTNVRFDLRKYISSGIDSDYFYANYAKANGIYDNPLDRQFRLRISEEYAYQFPWGIFTSTGFQTGNGVSANTPKYYNLYDLKLTFTYPTQQQAPIFKVGSVVELLDNGPSTNTDSINGIYTVLEVGTDYVVVNGVYDSTKTYYSGSILWSDRRQITNTATTYSSVTFTALNSCNEDGGKLYTSLPTNYNLRCNSVLLIPVIDYTGITVTNGATTVFSTATTATTSSLLKYIIPCTATTVGINVTGVSGGTDTRSFNIIDKCESKMKKSTLYFLDRKGAFIPYYFDLHDTKLADVTNTNWKGLNSDNRSVKYQIGTQVSEKYKLTTDWLNKAENTLFEELTQSSYIWMDYENSGIMQKVLIIEKSFEYKNVNREKLFNYTITVEVAKEKFVQNY